MVTPLTKFHWYLGFCFIHANTCVPAAIIGTLFLPLNRELNLFGLLILPDALKGSIWILTEASDSVHPEWNAFSFLPCTAISRQVAYQSEKASKCTRQFRLVSWIMTVQDYLIKVFQRERNNNTTSIHAFSFLLTATPWTSNKPRQTIRFSCIQSFVTHTTNRHCRLRFNFTLFLEHFFRHSCISYVVTCI